MPVGCKNPNAINYNPSATTEDYSCTYMIKNQGNCHWFIDLQPAQTNNESFTMSYSIKDNGSWVFFHDFFPDVYLHTRNKLYTAKDNSIYRHNSGLTGVYHQGLDDPRKPFFIDVVFKSDSKLIMETVNWITDFLQGGKILHSELTDQPFNTLSHITIWNSHQHTGRIALADLQEFKNLTARNTKGQWVFNHFRNILISKGVEFLQNIFNDYAIVEDQADTSQAWYKKELLTDKWFCVRFEFDNSSNTRLVLHDTTVQAIKSDR